jgi:hypothetical protein
LTCRPAPRYPLSLASKCAHRRGDRDHPQDIALMDARKGSRCLKVGVRIVGIVENMSAYLLEMRA